jgi:uncharacterized protein YdeI (YjbR/CyaY-like superfamily)
MDEPVFFRSAARFRSWLAKNHGKSSELWLGMYRKDSGRGGITYREALDQALCFGWIDGVRKPLDGVSYMQRFTPRRAGSAWSLVNINRAGELEREGLMHAAGLASFRTRDEKRAAQHTHTRQNSTFDAELERRFRARKNAWAFFQAQPPGYRRLTTWWVTSAKREDTRLRRLGLVIDASAAGQRIDMMRPNSGG